MDLITVDNVSTPLEIEQAVAWGEQYGQDNYFDRSILGYPSTRLLAARTGGKTILYLPITTAMVLESLAINPEASKHEQAVALREVFLTSRFIAQQNGSGEIMFLGTNQETNKFAEKHSVLKESKWKVWRAEVYPNLGDFFNDKNIQVGDNRHPDGGNPSGR